MIARFLALLGITALLAGCATGRGTTSTETITPAATAEYAEKAGVGRVLKVEPGENADWVILDAGHDQDVRPGMSITVGRQGKVIASLVVAETTARTAACLITQLAAPETVQPGDTAHITTN